MSEPPSGEAAAKAPAAEPDATEQSPDSPGDEAEPDTASSPTTTAAGGVPTFGSVRRWMWLAAVAAVLALLGAGVLGGLTFDATTLKVADRISPWLMASLGGLMFGSWLAAAGRVLLLTRGLGYRLRFRDAFVVAVAGEFGVAVSPAGVGGTALRLGFLTSRGLPLTGATSVVAADIALDAGAALLIGLAALPALLLLPRGRELGGELAAQVESGFDPRLAWAAGGLLLLLLLTGAGWRWWHQRRKKRRSSKAEGRLTRLRRRAADAFHRVRAGLGGLLRDRPGTVLLTFLLGLTQFGCRYSIMPLSVLALDPGVAGGLLALYPLQGLINGIAHAAVLPGGGGSAELGGGLALAFFLPTPQVMPAVLLWRLFTFHWNIFLGGGVFLAALGREGRRFQGE